MELNKIYNEDCLVTMERMKNEGVKVDMVLTSPPYNTSRVNNGSTVSHDTRRYDVYDDTMTNEEYLDFTLKLFQGYDSVLKENGVIVYDSFMGTGTTAAGCKQLGLTYIGSELSPAQCEYAEERLANYY